MVQYLLGKLSPEEREGFEEKLFTDDQCLAQLRLAEGRLIDEYVSDLLAEEDRNLFELFYLTSARRRRRVEMARALKAVAGELAASSGTAPATEPAREREQGLLSRLGSFTRAGGWQLRAALAGLALLLAVGLWLVRSGQQAGTDKTQTARTRPGQTESASAPVASPEGSPASVEAQKPAQAGESARSGVIVLDLQPGALRDTGEDVVSLRSGDLSPRGRVSRLRLRLPLAEAQRFTIWRVVVARVGGPELMRRSASRTVSREGQPYLVADMPATQLRSGDYVVTLLGRDAAGAWVEAEDYSFRITDR